MKLRSTFAVLLIVILLAGCNAESTPTPLANVPNNSGTPAADSATPTPLPTAPGQSVTGLSTRSSNEPTFTFMPRRGGPGTVVSITGGNVQPGSTVVVRIGIPEPIGEPLGSAVVGSDGRWTTTIKIPATEPSGKAISTSNMQIVAMDEKNNVLASMPFTFVPPK